jgi:hypothetical protein
MKTGSSILSLALILAATTSAFAGTVVLKFEGIVPSGQNDVAIGNFYDGGGGAANNFGITFSSNALALCLVTPTNGCGNNASRGGFGDPTSQAGGLLFLTGTSTFLDDSAGFTNGFSLFYSSLVGPGSLTVFSGLDGAGSVLGTLALPLTTLQGCEPQESAQFCPFAPVGLSFAGVGESIEFSGAANAIVFDDVTFGNATPDPVPEPSSLALLVTGLGAVATQLRRRYLRNA